MNNIYLTGFMGTGKSSTGREIARRLKWVFWDLDELIEKQEKKSIPDIFQEKGEPYFRELENKFLREISLKSKHVVSCGGGIVINPENIKLMKETGVMVCFSAKPEVILARTRKFSHRPLLNVPNPEEKIGSLLAERQKFYGQADIVVDTSELSIAQTAARVLSSLPEHFK
ncbi:MAG: shikimate kinase [Candidatus Omnitrophota bacterium]